jgi:hypothetical protein
LTVDSLNGYSSLKRDDELHEFNGQGDAAVSAHANTTPGNNFPFPEIATVELLMERGQTRG